MGRGKILILGGAVGLLLAGFSTMTGSKYMSGRNWNYVLPEMKQKVLQLLAEAKAQGLHVMFYNGWRSPAQEAADQKHGTSDLTSAYDSWHTWGAAADIVFKSALGEPEWPNADDPRWQKLGAIGKSLGLVWGGDWTTLRDMAHFQLANINVPELRQTYGTNYLAWLRNNGVTV